MVDPTNLQKFTLYTVVMIFMRGRVWLTLLTNIATIFAKLHVAHTKVNHPLILLKGI